MTTLLVAIAAVVALASLVSGLLIQHSVQQCCRAVAAMSGTVEVFSDRMLALEQAARAAIVHAPPVVTTPKRPRR